MRRVSLTVGGLLLFSFFSRTLSLSLFCFLFFFNDTATTEIYTLSLHDALPISHDAVPDPATCAEGL